MCSQTLGIACRSLTKSFGGAPVVADLSFEVAAGTITGFVGANGAGKTTTMRMVLGLVAPSSGQALVHGRAYRDLEEPRRQVGAVLDGPGAHPGHTARAHLAITATAARIPLLRVEEVLELVGLGEHAGRRVGSFSQGMRQRLALADALLGDPPVLILDEPVNGLDPPGIIWMRDLLRELAAEGRAVLVSSHLLGELAEVAHRVVIIDRGRLIADATVEDLVRGRSRVVELRCGDPGPVVGALRARGTTVRLDGDLVTIEDITAEEAGEIVSTLGAGPVHWLSERAASFEDAYLQLAGTLTEPPAPATAARHAS